MNQGFFFLFSWIFSIFLSLSKKHDTKAAHLHGNDFSCSSQSLHFLENNLVEKHNPTIYLCSSPATFSFLCPWKMIVFFFTRRCMGVAHTKKKSLPCPPSLMYTVPYVTRAFKDSWTSSFYKTETLRCFMRPPPLHTQPHLCPIHWCRLTGHLYVFCHTLEEFSICSMCDLYGCFFSHTNSVYRMLHANNEQTLCSGRQRSKSNCIGI